MKLTQSAAKGVRVKKWPEFLRSKHMDATQHALAEKRVS